MLAAFAMAALAACTTSQSSDSGSFLVGRGKFRFYDCTQLATQAKAAGTRQRELMALIAMAKQDTGGALVSALSYEPDLAVARGDLAEIQREQAEKKCPATAPSRQTMTLQRS
jgi:hypothetical protein